MININKIIDESNKLMEEASKEVGILLPISHRVTININKDSYRFKELHINFVDGTLTIIGTRQLDLGYIYQLFNDCLGINIDIEVINK